MKMDKEIRRRCINVLFPLLGLPFFVILISLTLPSQVLAQTAAGLNVASATNGAVASGSSTNSCCGFSPAGAINGNRRGPWGNGEGWNDGTLASFPDWIQVSFNGSKTISEIDVFSLQDNYQNPVEPTPDMTFSLYGLRAFDVQYWDGSGWLTVPGGNVVDNNKVWRKITFPAVITSKIRVVVNGASDGWSRVVEVEAWSYDTPTPKGGETVWVDDALPTGATPAGDVEGWNWVSANPAPFSGTVANQSNSLAGVHQHYFYGATSTLTIGAGDLLIAYVYLDPANVPSELMLQWNDGNWEHRAYWGANNISWGVDGTASRRYMGPLPSPGQWVRLEVSASQVGLEGRTLNGLAFTLFNGRATWDRAGKVSVTGVQTDQDFSTARLEPKNRTGAPGEDLLSGNYNWSLPVVSLPGRAGLDLNLALTYNSLVWTKSQSGSSIKFDVDQGFPSPGFRLGFPVIEPKYYNSRLGKYAYLMIMPSGSRVELRQIGATNTYEAADSSYLQLTEGDGLTVRTTDGTQLRYYFFGSSYQCTEIKDRNGNFISISYQDGRLSSVQDTVGRAVTFKYDANARLSSINQQWIGFILSPDGTQKKVETKPLVTFYYGAKTIQTGFSGINVIGPANGTQLTVLTAVSFADSSSYEFIYNNWGQVYQTKRRAPDGHELARVTYTMDAPTKDCPRFTERRDYAENWNDGQEAVTTFSVPTDTTRTMPDDGTTFTGTVCEVKSPDKTITKVYYPSSGWGKGLPVLNETVADSVTRRWVRTKWTQDNKELGYQQNPRPEEIITGDPEGNRKRTLITYQNFVLPDGTSCHLPVDVAEADATTTLRHVKTSYNLNAAYTSRRIIGLTDMVQLFEGVGENILRSKVSYSYDEAGYLADQPSLIQHDSSYGASFINGRGNLTGVRRWDVERPDQASYSVISRTGYNTAGSPVSATDASNHTTTISYADAYTGSGIVANTFAYPTEVKDASGFSSTLTYDYLTGSVTKARDPLGAETQLQYDSVGRITRRTIRDGVANVNVTYTRLEYLPNGTETRAYSLIDIIDGANVESFSLQRLDGVGRVIGTAASHPSSTSGYSGAKISYDVMGRASARTNPAEITDPKGVEVSKWTPSGDDALAGWQWMRQSYDWKGRPTTMNYADGRIRQVSYGGCGCAGGEVVTVTDEGGRIQKIYHDVFGRPVKSEVMNPDGTVYAANVSIYNGRDQVTFSREYKGAAVEGSCPSNTCRETVNTYDGHGRLSTAKGPEQDRPFKYSYNPDDTINVVEDPRGVILTLTYDARHLARKLEYTVPNDPATGVPYANIPSTPAVEFGYDAAGNRKWMTDGTGRVDYNFDNLGQLKSEKRFFSDLASTTSGGIYNIEYDYNLAGELKSIKDPFSRISYAYNAAGQVKSIKGDPYAGVTDYITDIKYRSWGAAKEVTYGNHLKALAEYEGGLRLKHFELNGATKSSRTGAASSSTAMSADYDYYRDGSLRFADNKLNDRFDRAYEYDHVGRIKEAYSDVTARKFFYPGNTEATRAEPYRQSYRYDEWDNLRERNSKFWSQGTDNFAAEYDSRNRITDPQWEYDAAGNETRNSNVAFTYDAARNNVKADSLSGTVKNQQWFDGEGEVAKRTRIETSDIFKSGQPITLTITAYYLRSSVVDGQVLVELDATGSRGRGYVYNGNTVIAVQSEPSTVGVKWQHRDPLTGSYGQSNSSGEYVQDSEYDPTGVNVRLTDPNVTTSSFGTELRRRAYLTSGSGLGNCTLDGIEIDCAMAAEMMRSGAAAPCPDDDCSPRWNPNRDGQGHGGWQVFAPTLKPDASDWWLNIGPVTGNNNSRLYSEQSSFINFSGSGAFASGQKGKQKKDFDDPSERKRRIRKEVIPGGPGTRSPLSPDEADKVLRTILGLSGTSRERDELERRPFVQSVNKATAQELADRIKHQCLDGVASARYQNDLNAGGEIVDFLNPASSSLAENIGKALWGANTLTKSGFVKLVAREVVGTVGKTALTLSFVYHVGKVYYHWLSRELEIRDDERKCWSGWRRNSPKVMSAR